MTALFFDRFPTLDGHFCLLLTYGLVHFLWQGCLLTLLFALVRRPLAGALAQARYAAGVVTLLLMAACLPVTLALVEPASFRAGQGDGVPRGAGASGFDPAAPQSAELQPATPLVARTPVPAPSDQRAFWLAPLEFGGTLLPGAAVYAAVAYAAGLVLMLARVFVGLWIGRGLRRLATPITDSQTLDFVRRQAGRLALRAVPSVAWCRRVSVPVVVGVVRPMILLPAALVTGLAARQLELILLHELAHIHRFDPLVNLVQRLVETLLFFHPAVWWVSRQVSLEREQACDDAVLRAGSDGPAYADALLRVAELFAALSGTAAGPTGSLAAINRDKNQLRRRILRLLAADRPAPLRPAAPAAALMGLLFACAILGLAVCRRPAIAQVTELRAIDAEAPTTAGEDQPANVAPRVLHFPADRAMGFLWTRPAQADYSTLVYHMDLQPLSVARGDVNVPAGVDVQLDVGNVASKDLTGLAGLAPDDVQFLNFRYTQLDDEGLRHVGRLSGLRSLNLMYAAAVSDAGVGHLAGLKQLRAIRFDGLQARRLGGGIGDAALAALAGLPELRRVDVRRMPKITDAGLGKLVPLKKLIELDLGGTSITDAGLATLRQFPLLENLDLGVYRDGAPITDAGLVEIGALRPIEVAQSGRHRHHRCRPGSPGSVDPAGNPVAQRHGGQPGWPGEIGAAPVAPHLRFPRHGKPSSTSFRHRRGLASPAQIAHAHRRRPAPYRPGARRPVDPGGPGADRTGRARNHRRGGRAPGPDAEIEVAVARDCPLGDSGLAQIATLPALEKLNLYGTAITGDGLAPLAEAKTLTSLGVNFDDRRQLEHAAHQISKLTGLKTLNISGKTQIYVQLFQNLDHLEELRIDSTIDNVQASYIAQLASLRMLVLRQSTITDSGLEELAQLNRLNVLHVEGYFTDKGLASLARLKELENLNIASPYVSQSALDSLAAALPALQTIQLHDNDPLRELRRRQAQEQGEGRSTKKMRFIGNTITRPGRLETQTESKPPILGPFMWHDIEQNAAAGVDKLAEYYRNLGFFRARSAAGCR